MEENTSSFVCFYIFYDHTLWHRLITDLIKPLIDNEELLIGSYSLYFSYDRGDHLQLIFSSSRDKDEFKKLVSALTGSYITQNPSIRNKGKKPSPKSFFMDYYNNTFWFDRYETETVLKKKLSFSNRRISQAMIEALGDEPVDEEMTFTFVVYLQFGLIRAAFDSQGEALKAIDMVLHSLEREKTAVEHISVDSIAEKENGNLEDVFENYKEFFFEIVNDIFDKETAGGELVWMKNWIEACRSFLLKSDFRHLYLGLNHQIYLHLGLDVDRQLIAIPLRLIEKTLVSIAREKNQPAPDNAFKLW